MGLDTGGSGRMHWGLNFWIKAVFLSWSEGRGKEALYLGDIGEDEEAGGRCVDLGV